MKLQFIKPGSVVEGTIQNVEVNNRGNFSFLEISWLADGQTIRESHFMTNYDEIVEELGKINIDIDTDTDTWIGTPAKLLIESNDGYLNASIVGPADTIEVGGEAIDLDVVEEPVKSNTQSVDDFLND